jgi:hypothetical protein
MLIPDGEKIFWVGFSIDIYARWAKGRIENQQIKNAADFKSATAGYTGRYSSCDSSCEKRGLKCLCFLYTSSA